MVRRPGIFCFILLLAASTYSCSEQRASEQQDGSDAGASAVTRDFGTGPVKLTIALSAGAISTADALTCTLTLRTNDGYEAEFPDLAFPMDLPGMILTGYSEDQTVQEGRALQVRRYELEPEYAGAFELPSLQVYYHRENEIREEMFETEAIALTVTETPASAEMLALKPLRGLITVEQIEAQRRRLWPWVLSGLAGGTLLVVVVAYLWRRPRPAPAPRPAHELAMDALRALARQDLVSQGQIEPFFVEVTRIVREYIESAFGLRAPEQTTEEFLANISSAPMVAEYRGVLEPFLTAADEVKFARAKPETSAIQRTFDTARDFILQTSGTEGGVG